MANRLENEFSDGEVLDAADLNDTIDAVVPIGSIIAWHKDKTGVPALPAGWVECNGQTLSNPDSPLDGQDIPNLNGNNRFLRGNNSSGGTGGRSDTDMTFSFDGRDDTQTDPALEGVTINGDQQSSNGNDQLNFNFTNEPQYFNVVMIMRVA